MFDLREKNKQVVIAFKKSKQSYSFSNVNRHVRVSHGENMSLLEKKIKTLRLTQRFNHKKIYLEMANFIINQQLAFNIFDGADKIFKSLNKYFIPPSFNDIRNVVYEQFVDKRLHLDTFLCNNPTTIFLIINGKFLKVEIS